MMILRHLSFIFALLAALWLVLLPSSSSSTMPHQHQRLWGAEAAPAPFDCSSPDGNLVITQDDTTDISDQIEILALDQCNVIINDITVGSIEFQNSITDSNITIRNVTCTSESSPFCIKFSSTIESALSTRQYDFVSISDVTFGVGSSFTSSTTLLQFAQALTIPSATFSNILFQDFSATVPSGWLLVYGLNFQGLVTCPSLSITSIFLSNAFLRIVASTFTNLISIAFDSEVNSGVLSSSSSSSEPTSSLFMSNVSILNCRFSIETTDSNRLVSGVRLSAITIGFQLVEISNILLHDIYGGLLLGNGSLEFTNLRVDTTLSAVPSSESSSSSALATSLTIYNITALDLRGQAGSGHAVAHSLRFGLFIEYFSVIRISHIFTSNVTFTGSRSTSVGVTQIFHGQPNSFQSASSTTSIHYSDIAVHGRIHLESASGPLSVIPFALRNIANYSSVTIENIFVADEGIVMTGGSSKIIIGVQVVSEESSVNSSGGPYSSFLIHNITVPSPASTSSAHTSYVTTTENLFNNVNDFYNVTISQLTYLGEWTVPSNLVSSGPVVFSILDSNATSILFNTTISDSNVTISGVTCELNPAYCIGFEDALTNLGTLNVNRVNVVSTAVSNAVVFNTSINNINDTLAVDHVSLSISHQGSTTILPYAVAFYYAFSTTNVNRLSVTNVAIVSSNVATTAGNVHLSALTLHAAGSMTNILISNISVRDTKVTGPVDVRIRAVITQSGVSIATSSSSEPTSLIVANVSIVNCRFMESGATGASNREAMGVSVPSEIIGFERVKISNILLWDIDGGLDTGYIGFYNLGIGSKISAPSSYSAASSLIISNISAIDLRGQVGSFFSSVYSIVLEGSSIEYFNSIRISQLSTSNIALKATGDVQVAVIQIYQLTANSLVPSSPTTSVHISDCSLSGPVNLESELGPQKVLLIMLKSIANYASVTIENVLIVDENLVLTGPETRKELIGVIGAPSITSSGGPSSSFLIRNITVPSPASASSAHTSYASTNANLFGNVNDFYNVTISQLTYLGEWTVPSNLVSSGPVVFSILDSNATSILFNTAISDSSEVTISRLTSLCSGATANCALIHFGPKSLADGAWNITSTNVTSPSSHLISAESTSIFSKTLTMNLRDNYIDITSDILSQTTGSSLNSSTWNLICNHWPRPVYSRFAASLESDSSNPTLKLKTCLLTRTKTKTQSRPPTRTVTPPPTQTAVRSSSKSTSITTTLSLSSTPSVFSASQSDSFLTKTSELTSSRSITHETPSLSNSKSDVLISRLLRDAISQSVQNLGIAVTGIKGGSSATNARKIQAVVAMADCGKEDISDDEIPEIEPDSNPLTLRVGSRRFDTYRGSIVGAFLFILLWGILMFTFAYIRTRIEYGCSLKRALRKVGMPGTLSAPGFCLLPVAVNSASAMMMRYKSPGFEQDSAVDLTIVVFGFIIGVCVPLGVLAWTIREVMRHEKFVTPTEEDYKTHDDDKKDEDELEDPTWKEWFDWLTEPRYEYKKSKFSQAWGPIFDFVTFPFFILLSFVVTIAMEIAEGSSSLCPKGDRTCCSGGVVSMIALCSLDTLLIMFYKIPFLVRIDYVVIPVCSVINVAMAALIYEMFQDSTSNERSLASGFMLKRIGNQNFDMSDEKNSSGGVVDHTETLVILSQAAFYLALLSGLLGLLNELFGAMFEVRAAYWSGQWKKKKEKKLADLRNIDDLEEELLPVVADEKKNSSPSKNKLLLEAVAANQKTCAPNKNIVGGKNNSNKDSPASHPRRKKSFTEGHGSVEVRNNSPSPVGRRKRQQIGEQIGASRSNNNNNNPSSSPRPKSREKPLPASPPLRLTAEALSKLNRKNSR